MNYTFQKKTLEVDMKFTIFNAHSLEDKIVSYHVIRPSASDLGLDGEKQVKKNVEKRSRPIK